MRIGLISDSHGNIKYVKKVGQYLKEKARVDLIVHLGDECDDVDVIRDLGIEIIKIPGIFSTCYQDPAMPNRVVKEIEGIKVLMTHSTEAHPNDLPEGIKAVLYGHTHVPSIENKDGVVWINPGHLRESDKKGTPASFAVVEIKQGRIDARIIRYDEMMNVN